MSVKTYVVDLKKEKKLRSGSLFSSFLLSKIEETLAKKEQVILFLNKRGHSSSLLCTSCGNTALCTHCDLSLTHHKHPNGTEEFLLCHFCGTKFSLSNTCTSCKKNDMQFIGSGTQKIESEIRAFFPKARVLRLDMDTTRAKGAHSSMYEQMRSGKVDIILGTQILAKGLDLPEVSLVGVLQADQGLQIPDFRASEKTFQLLTQVMGRASRRGQDGVVVIQTYLPESPLIRFATQLDYEGFYQSQIEERKMHGYPPFAELIKFIYVHHDQKKAYGEAKKFFDFLKGDIVKEEQDAVCYLTPAYIAKQHDKYHYHVLLKGKNIHTYMQQLSLPSGWRIDVDPVSTS